ncbi:Amyotrophic lateral sclerosis 2 chromosomal region candidate protein 8 protein [Myotis brandtii]|uniref:Amyotrophic lateral sclerosis 2 chromosomal region candidate protein 8 protein n=1 Tax=Myotis brandtii TaxID=109478 RepID=S7N6Q6_MYOBR|nr:Amyotrophic lateral sclerosis 2 chromosomal region candidate protein 8 protein [Myotis brandtii]
MNFSGQEGILRGSRMLEAWNLNLSYFLKHSTCIDSRDPSFGQNSSDRVLPVTTHEADNSLTSQNIPGPLTQAQTLSAEQFHLVDQNGQPIQYELQSLEDSNAQMMIVASSSENGQMLRVIPSTQTGMTQVIIPQGQLVDMNSPQDASEEKPSNRNLPTARLDALADHNSSYILHPQASLTLPQKTVTRIYIKKVQKFPEYRVPTDPKIDKKIIRMEQEKAFNVLKKNLVDAGGVFRWYVQLPTQQAHQYHELETPSLPLSPSPFPVSSMEEEETAIRDENCTLPSRLHPQVAHKIQELVSQGIEQVYAVRKHLRKFVERELFKSDEVPERHNLSFFPTVNDIKNHIHEVQKSLRNGDNVSNSEIIPATGLQLQPRFTSPDGSPALISVNDHLSSSPSRLLDSIRSTVINNNSLQCGQSHGLQTDTCLTPNNSIASTMDNLPAPDQNVAAVDQLVDVGDAEDTENLEGSVHRFLLGNVQTIPIQIIDSHPPLIEENPEGTISVNQVKQEPKEPALSMEAKSEEVKYRNISERDERVPPAHPLVGGGTRNLGMCPDWESNR